MFPLSYACVRTHTGHEMSAHTRKLGTHINIPSKNVFARISYMSFQIQMSPCRVLHKRNLMRTQTLKNYREHLYGSVCFNNMFTAPVAIGQLSVIKRCFFYTEAFNFTGRHQRLTRRKERGCVSGTWTDRTSISQNLITARINMTHHISTIPQLWTQTR